jgi:hypothetical protein
MKDKVKRGLGSYGLCLRPFNSSKITAQTSLTLVSGLNFYVHESSTFEWRQGGSFCGGNSKNNFYSVKRYTFLWKITVSG